MPWLSHCCECCDVSPECHGSVIAVNVVFHQDAMAQSLLRMLFHQNAMAQSLQRMLCFTRMPWLSHCCECCDVSPECHGSVIAVSVVMFHQDAMVQSLL